MNADLLSFVGRGYSAAIEAREKLAFALAADWISAHVNEETVGLTLLAGAGTRWVKSLIAAKQASISTHNGAAGSTNNGTGGQLVADFPLEAPRGLFPVRNFISSSPPNIPMAMYALDAMKNLGRHVIVVRGWEDEIRAGILDPLDIRGQALSFYTQEQGPGGKVLGHGDAAWQSRGKWIDSRYVVTNFGGDVNSPLTVMASLLAMAELDRAGEDVDLLLPVAKIRNPAYPVILDDEGLPRSFGHDKLGGVSGTIQPSIAAGGFGYTNVGIRVYKTKAFAGVVEEIRRNFWQAGEGYVIPGNDPQAREFALDNVDVVLAGRGKARILAIARPEELTPAKSYDEIGNFENAAGKVRAEWDRFRSALDAQYPSNPWTGKGVECP